MKDQYSIIKLDQNIEGCDNFKWYEFVYLKMMKSYVIPTEKIKIDLILTAQVLQKIRDLVGRPILVTSGYRPTVYNRQIGGAKRSQHVLGKAVDFKVSAMNSDKVRSMIEPFLDEFQIRMEKYPGSTWIHIDRKVVGKNRYFRP